MPLQLPPVLYAAMPKEVQGIVDQAIDVLMEYTQKHGGPVARELLLDASREQHREALISEMDCGDIRLELRDDLLVWLCYLPEKDVYAPVGAALRVKKDCPFRN